MTLFRSTVIFALLLAGYAHSQTPPARPEFEVADIKPADPSTAMPGKGRLLPGGRIELPGMTVKNFIRYAYGVEEKMIVGAPKWAETDRFDVVAKADDTTPPETLRLMFQSLLADRFKLTIHREDKVMPAYVLSVGKRAAKYQEGNGAGQQCNWSNIEGGLRRRECHNLTMAELARQLPGWGGVGIDLSVVDETGLKGAYDFQLDVGRGEMKAGDGGAAGDPGPTIFSALEQIGLKLESRKMPLPAIVIDHVERPAAN